MTDPQRTTAEQLSGIHLLQQVRIVPGKNENVAVSGRLTAVEHSDGNLTHVWIELDQNNTVDLHLRYGVVIEFFNPTGQ